MSPPEAVMSQTEAAMAPTEALCQPGTRPPEEIRRRHPEGAPATMRLTGTSMLTSIDAAEITQHPKIQVVVRRWND